MSFVKEFTQKKEELKNLAISLEKEGILDSTDVAEINNILKNDSLNISSINSFENECFEVAITLMLLSLIA